MLKYTNRFAEALLDYADEMGLELVYRQALHWVTQLGKIRRGFAQADRAQGQAPTQELTQVPVQEPTQEPAQVPSHEPTQVTGQGRWLPHAMPPGETHESAADLEAEPPLGLFLKEVPRGQREDVLDHFIHIARERLNLVDAEVISAVPLTPRQMQIIEIRLIRMLKKQINLAATVDQSLIGGIRIIVGSVVIDDSIKRKLSDMRNSIFKGVFQSE